MDSHMFRELCELQLTDLSYLDSSCGDTWKHKTFELEGLQEIFCREGHISLVTTFILPPYV